MLQPIGVNGAICLAPRKSTAKVMVSYDVV
jgi:hypothetical protein